MVGRGNIIISQDVAGLASSIQHKMPALDFAIWDLTPFHDSFHDLRKNMIVIECDKIAHAEIVKMIATSFKWKNWLVYAGEKRPVLINEQWLNASKNNGEKFRFEHGVIGIINRTDFKEADKIREGVYSPWVERQIVDLLAYSYRHWLPITTREAIDVLTWALKKSNVVKISKLHRYSTRRYINWLLSALLYQLVENGEISKEKVDNRYLDGGRNIIQMINMVRSNVS